MRAACDRVGAALAAFVAGDEDEGVHLIETLCNELEGRGELGPEAISRVGWGAPEVARVRAAVEAGRGQWGSCGIFACKVLLQHGVGIAVDW